MKMVGSPANSHPQNDESSQENEPQEENKGPQRRLCDFCGESKALLYCRADSAKLCFNCDREVHSTNPLFTKHTRSQLCDFCDSNPASILCSTENLVLCQNCDWDSHGRSSSSVHDRRSLEGFTGCPSGVELFSILGVEGVEGKCALSGMGDFPTSGSGEFSDLLVWGTPPISSIDDVIGSTESTQKFQAMGNPTLPKTRSTTCGKYREEILSQLRDMVTLENCFIDDHIDLESLLGFQPLVPDLLPETMDGGLQHHSEPITLPSYEEDQNKQEGDIGEAAVQIPFPSAYLGSYAEPNSVVLDKRADVDDGADANCDNDNQISHSGIKEAPHIAPNYVLHKSVTLNRDSSISRYKEKRKTRRYDHHVRYESRKARADGRSRIRGRFAKVEH